jgi:uncharacterized SAM-dependent methyltransferase
MKSFRSSAARFEGVGGPSKSAALKFAPSRGSDGPAEPIEIDPDFAADVIAGSSASEKALAAKYFYDAAGSDLFEAICKTPEYYPARTERALLKRIALEMAAEIPDSTVLVEFGSGASDKTRVILDAAPQIAAYVPIDVSKDALERAAARLSLDYPELLISPVAEDFNRTIELPAAAQGRTKVGFFPGSTIGNLTQDEAVGFLHSARHLLGDDAQFIIGAFLKTGRILERVGLRYLQKSQFGQKRNYRVDRQSSHSTTRSTDWRYYSRVRART